MNKIKKLILNNKNYNKNYNNIINKNNYIKIKINYSKYDYINDNIIILNNHIINYNFINKNKLKFIDIKTNQNYYIEYFKKYYNNYNNLKLNIYYDINIKHIKLLKLFINKIDYYSNNKNIRQFNQLLSDFINHRPKYITESIRIKIDDNIKESYFKHFDKFLERYL